MLAGSPSSAPRVSWTSFEKINDGSDDEFFDAPGESLRRLSTAEVKVRLGVVY